MDEVVDAGVLVVLVGIDHLSEEDLLFEVFDLEHCVDS